MVLQRRPLDYGFNGYQVPFTPRRPRSSRGKRSAGKKTLVNRMCAFDLLATVAGELLLEKRSSALSKTTAEVSETTFPEGTVKYEQQDEVKPFRIGPCYQGICNEGIQASEIGFQRQSRVFTLKECLQASSNAGLGPGSIIVKPDPSEEVASAEEPVFDRNEGRLGDIAGTSPGKSSSKRQPPVFAGSCRAELEDGISPPLQFGGRKAASGFHGVDADPCCLEEPMKVDLKPPPLLSSESSVEVPVHGDHVPRSSSFPRCKNGMVRFPVDRDDDEKSSGCTQPCYIPSKSIRTQRIGDRRIRKLLASRFWKVGPSLLRDEDFSNTDEEAKAPFSSRKMCYTRQRTQRCPFKRRRLFGRGSISTSDGKAYREGVYCSPEVGIKGELSCSPADAAGASSSVTDQKTSFESKDYSVVPLAVKLSIKSFKVPELFIEIPETATVGSLKVWVLLPLPVADLPFQIQSKLKIVDPKGAETLAGHSICSLNAVLAMFAVKLCTVLEIKNERLLQEEKNPPVSRIILGTSRTVVEALTAVLAGGFGVGVFLQGKKLREDNKTLLQVGISRGDKLDSLGFSLEPTPSSQAPNKLTTNIEDSHIQPLCDGSGPPKGLPAVPASDAVMVDACTSSPSVTTSGKCIYSDHDSAPSPETLSLEKNSPYSKALVAVPAMEVEALAIVPFPGKSRRAETVPRRIRRPFSVSEVEALVQAVEKLGTGRWRDVKLRAFENAKHRTYVDLKDKWKTLVHTAKISPQQRRGEPVPQELLDRVLSANAYWSQHQAKLQVKQPPPPPPLLLT